MSSRGAAAGLRQACGRGGGEALEVERRCRCLVRAMAAEPAHSFCHREEFEEMGKKDMTGGPRGKLVMMVR